MRRMVLASALASVLMRRSLWIVCVLVTAAAFGADTPIRYRVTLPAPQTHNLEVEARIPTDGKAAIDLMMPVWIPGSYLVREFSRHVEGIAARTTDGKPLPISKTRKNRWRVDTGRAAEVLVTYRLYGREMTVDTNWIGPDFAILQGPATFITRLDALSRPHEVRLILPAAWKQSVTGMPSIGPHHYRAADYDVLVDSPILAGNPLIQRFEGGGKEHLIVNAGDHQLWDAEKAVGDVKKIVEEHLRLWGQLPYDRYVFFNLIVDAGGGLEHRNSTVMMVRPLGTRTRKTFVRWLGLVSHEFFHTWNVKRLRPAALGPFDYENEVHTTDLWIAEGFTSYYDDLILVRSGVITQKEYLERLSTVIETVQTTPGRLAQPVDLASFDAWIRHYRRDENSPNVALSYYDKGASIAFALDGMIRSATNGQRSLDDVMRLAYQRHAGPRGYTSEQFEEVVAEIGGKNLGEWLRRVTATTEELDYRPAMQWLGLRFKPEETKPSDEPKEEKAWLGIETKITEGKLIVGQVRRQTSAYESGLSVDDEILGIDQFRVSPNDWSTRLETYRPGDKATLLVARRSRIIPVEVQFEKEPSKLWQFDVDPNATEVQKAHLAEWSHRGTAHAQ